MPILEVKGLNKTYEKFKLEDVSFSLDKGYIMGFIGANGAGKTTTIKSILNLITADSGDITVLDKNFKDHEIALKSEIGFMFGDVEYYSNSKVKVLTSVTKRFYKNWDDAVYNRYLKRFNIDEDKKIKELSSGMRVKYYLALALSHNAQLLILDEPTSGLDPVARDDLLEIFQELIKDGEMSILFSTHITSDLEKCADYIAYINNGKIIECSSQDELIASYRLVRGSKNQLNEVKSSLVSYRENSFGFSGLIKTENLNPSMDVESAPPSLEDIMVYYARKEKTYE